MTATYTPRHGDRVRIGKGTHRYTVHMVLKTGTVWLRDIATGHSRWIEADDHARIVLVAADELN